MKIFKFKINGQKFDVEIKNFEDKVAQIEVNGTVYDVEIESEVKQPKTPKIVRKPVLLGDEGKTVNMSASGPSTVKAPLPGSIFQLKSKVGDQVKKGQVLLVMEAMKMENDILAEKDGTISAIKVNVGDAVLQGDVLVELS
jgi:biotin carboxyl carrier protein